MWVEEKIRIFTLWHFYGGNCAMAWWLELVTELFGGGQKPLGAFVFYF